MTDPKPARGGPRRPLRRLFLVLLALPAGLLVAELAYRGWCLASGSPYRSAALQRELVHIVETMNQPVPTAPGRQVDDVEAPVPVGHVVHPYYGFEVSDAHGMMATQSMRYRGRPRGEPGEPYLVVIVGGSVSGMLAVDGGERLRERLAADPRLQDRAIEVLNHGRGSFKQPQQQMLFSWLLALGIEPDVLINVDGFNEVALGNHNASLGLHPLYPHWTRWGHLAGIGANDPVSMDLAQEVWLRQRSATRLLQRTLDGGWHRSALAGRFVASRLYGLRREWGDFQRRYLERISGERADAPVRGPAAPRGTGQSLAVIAHAWQRSSRAMQAACDDLGITYLHVLQPTLHDAGSKPLTAEEVRTGGAPEAWVEGVVEGYPLLRAAGAELRAQGVHFADLSGVFAEVTEPLYFDACHVFAEGSELFAERIAEELLAVLPPS